MADAIENGDIAPNTRSASQPVERINNFIISIWLFLLYLATIVISILMLSSYQIQSRMQYVEVSGARLSIWRLNELSDAYALQQKEQAIREDALNRREIKLAGIDARVTEFDNQYKPIFDAFYRDIRSFKSRYEIANPTFEFVPLEKHHSSVKILFKDIEKQLESVELDGSFKEEYDDLERRYEEGDDIFRNISSAKKNAANVQNDIDRQRGELSEIVERVKLGIFGIIKSDKRYAKMKDEQVAQLQDAVSEFVSLRNIFWEIPFKLAIMPTEILVLFLVLAMGVLGSTIFITQVFFKRNQYQGKFDEDLDLAFFFSRPLFGAIMALSIFVLAKAGVLFLTDPAGGASRSTLSPFFISFIAIISGLFSEQAIQAIRKAAEQWFRNQNAIEERWGIGLGQAVTQSGRDVANFGKTHGVPVETIDSWIQEEASVPSEMQALLSAWLEQSPRDLFTDLPPKKERKPEPMPSE